MNDRKNHNSLLFLTTLGVYLGLVLVGGTAPQVFAHGALTRNFEISEEVEVKDDLDTKPDAIADGSEASGIQLNEDSFVETVRNYLNGQMRIGAVALVEVEHVSLFRPEIPVTDYASLIRYSDLSFDQHHFAVVSRLPRASIDPHFAENAR